MPLNIQQEIISRRLNVIQQLQNFPAKMTKLKIDNPSINNAELKIKKVLIAIIIGSLLGLLQATCRVPFCFKPSN